MAARTRELADAIGRLTILDRSKNEFLTLISHEFRTPLNGLLGISGLILDEMPSTQKNDEFQTMFERSRRRLLSILDDALLLTQIDVGRESFKLVPVSLSAALTSAIENTAGFAESRRVGLPPPLTGLGLVLGVEELLVRALGALLQTAVKFSEAGETVRFASEDASDSLRVLIESQGRTIPSSVLPRFFDIFSIGEAMTPGGDLGLGPPVAYRILSLFGGLVSVANRDPSGVRFTISLRNSARNGSDARGSRFAENAFSSPLTGPLSSPSAALGSPDREFGA